MERATTGTYYRDVLKSLLPAGAITSPFFNHTMSARLVRAHGHSDLRKFIRRREENGDPWKTIVPKERNSHDRR